MTDAPQFDTRKAVDFVIVGSGSAGGIIAKELSTAGFDVVVLEQGPYRNAADFTHDEIDVVLNYALADGGIPNTGQTFRDDESTVAEQPSAPPADYAQTVGGSSVHFSGNFWRLRESDFKERSLWDRLRGLTSRIGRSVMRNLSRITPGSTGRSAYPGPPARRIRIDQSRFPCHRWKSVRPACCWKRLPINLACMRKSNHSPF